MRLTEPPKPIPVWNQAQFGLQELAPPARRRSPTDRHELAPQLSVWTHLFKEYIQNRTRVPGSRGAQSAADSRASRVFPSPLVASAHLQDVIIIRVSLVALP